MLLVILLGHHYISYQNACHALIKALLKCLNTVGRDKDIIQNSRGNESVSACVPKKKMCSYFQSLVNEIYLDLSCWQLLKGRKVAGLLDFVFNIMRENQSSWYNTSRCILGLIMMYLPEDVQSHRNNKYRYLAWYWYAVIFHHQAWPYVITFLLWQDIFILVFKNILLN